MHGTFSTTTGSYGALASTPSGKRFLAAAAKRYDAVVGLDHPTLSVTPLANAERLFELLGTVPGPPPLIDAVGFSRGGLVVRSLIEHVLPDVPEATRPTVQRAVFVGAANGGTQLAEPDNWHRLIDLYTNLAIGATRIVSGLSGATVVGEVVGGVLRGVGGFAKHLATEGVSDLIPGLNAMEPDDEFISTLNATQEGQPGPRDAAYFAVTSNFDAQLFGDGKGVGLPQRLLKAAADGLVDQLMGHENDMVVDVPSMTRIDPHVGPWVAERLDLSGPGANYHTAYFSQEPVVQRIGEWLELASVPRRRAAATSPPPPPPATPELPPGVETSLLVVAAGERASSVAEAVARARPGWVVVRERRDAATFYAFEAQELLDEASAARATATIATALGLRDAPPSPSGPSETARVSGHPGWPTTDRYVVTADGEPVGVWTPSPASAEPPPMVAANGGGAPAEMPKGRAPRRSASGRRAARSGAGAGATAAPEAREAAAHKEVRRTPHMDLSEAEPLAPGASIGVTVYLDRKAARAGERTEDVVIVTDRAREELVVRLVVSRGLSIAGRRVARIVLDRTEDATKPVRFRVRIGATAREGATEEIAAYFAHEGRPSGSVIRQVRVGTQAPPRRPRRQAEVAATVRVDPSAVAPDMVIQIHRTKQGDDSDFDVTVTSRHLPELDASAPTVWDLSRDTHEIVEASMEGFVQEGASTLARRAQLLGAGADLWDAAPSSVKDAMRRLVDGGFDVRSIYVVSSEPSIPWELMVPSDLGDWDDTPLGTRFAVGRWIHEAHLSPVQRVPLKDSYVVRPDYEDLAPLPNGKAEAKLVLKSFPGDSIEPATFDGIEATLAGGGRSLMHFICHGEDPVRVGVQVIRLAEGTSLSSLQVRGMPALRKALEAAGPLVFLNACEVGRETPALTGAGGFASSFIKEGARCVIAPLWSVDDVIANEVATRFYKEVVRSPTTPFAEILRGIRELAYEDDGGEDSYAAYCFYGDPLAAAA